MDEYYQVIRRLPEQLQARLATLPSGEAPGVREIRLRSGRPAELRGERTLYPDRAGGFCDDPDGSPALTHSQLQECFYTLCGQSVHSRAPELRQGFVTLPGGHRVGVAGIPIREETGLIAGFKTVTSLNLRIARRCSVSLPPEAAQALQNFTGLLVAGPPGSGKTTLLRAVAAQLCRMGQTVAVVDERCELFPCGMQGFAFELPLHCDVLSAWPKARGILQAVRTLCPDVILCDELGDEEEVRAVMQGLHAGVRFVLTVHAASREDLARRPPLRELTSTGAFDRLILLESSLHPGRIRRVMGL